jgi:hypothetical protein
MLTARNRVFYNLVNRRGKMKNRTFALLALIIFFGTALGCEKGPPPEVLKDVDAEIAAAEAAYEDLMKLNPPSTMTFHYRTYMKEAEDAREAGDYEKALEAARKAKEQAKLARKARIQGLAELKRELEEMKPEIEHLFMPPLSLVDLYWDALETVEKYDYEKAKKLTEEFKFKLDQEKKMTYVETKYLTVTAPEEYIRKWGNPRVYGEITPEGKLSGKSIVATVAPHTEVMLIKTMMYSRYKTFYLVEIPGVGIQGWMAEQYLAPERLRPR